jgi:hypothetical protein
METTVLQLSLEALVVLAETEEVEASVTVKYSDIAGAQKSQTTILLRKRKIQNSGLQIDMSVFRVDVYSCNDDWTRGERQFRSGPTDDAEPSEP